MYDQQGNPQRPHQSGQLPDPVDDPLPTQYPAEGYPAAGPRLPQPRQGWNHARYPIYQQQDPRQTQHAPLSVAAIVVGCVSFSTSLVWFLAPLGFIAACVGLGLSISARKKAPNKNSRSLASVGLGFSIAAMILGAVMSAFAIYLFTEVFGDRHELDKVERELEFERSRHDRARGGLPSKDFAPRRDSSESSW